MLDEWRFRVRALLAVTRREPFDTSTPVGRSNERYRRMALTTIANVAARLTLVAVNLVAVPVVLAYLGKERFGLWTTVMGLVSWAALFDFGLLNGLVNRIAEAHARDDRESARVFVSSALALLTVMSATVLVVLGVAAPWVPWRAVFAVKDATSNGEIALFVAAAVGSVALTLPLSVVRQVYAGTQRAYVGALFSIVGSLLTLGAILAAVLARASMPALALAFSGAGVLALAVNLAYLLLREMPWLRPAVRVVSAAAIRRLLRTSFPMFMFQVGALLVNESQALILAHVAGLRVVADYSVAWRLYVLPVGLITLATSSFAPAFREAHERGESAWSASSFRHVLAVRIAASLAALAVLLVAGNLLLRVWLRTTDIQFGADVWVSLGLMTVLAVWAGTFTDVLNIMDRVWPQVVIVVVQGLATVGLTALLGGRMGVLGALLAQLVPGLLLSAALLPRLARPFLAPGRASQRGA